MTTPAAPTVPSPALLRAAFVRRPHGVRGEVRVEPLGGDASRFAPGLRLRREDTGGELVVRSARSGADGDLLLGLEGVDDRNAAAALRDAYLCVEAAARRPLGDDEWFTWELVGLRVRTAGGQAIGTVVDVEAYPEQDVLVVRGDDAGERRLPLVRAFVRRVDLAAGEVEVTPWPEEGEA